MGALNYEKIFCSINNNNYIRCNCCTFYTYHLLFNKPLKLNVMRKYLVSITSFYKGKNNLCTQQMQTDNWDILEGFLFSVILSNTILHNAVEMKTHSITVLNRETNKVSHPSVDEILKRAKKEFGFDLRKLNDFFNDED